MSYLCERCGNEGVIFGYERQRPDALLSWRCDCAAGNRHPARGIAQWRDEMKEKFQLENEKPVKVKKEEVQDDFDF